MTFSLIARDSATGAFGAVICSSSPAVSARCVHLADGAGGVLSQNVTDPRLGPRILDSLARGHGASAAVDTDPDADWRQLLAVDGSGGTAIHSGRHALGIVGEYQREGAAAAGNMLATPLVPQRLVDAWHSATGPLESRLVAAYSAAVEEGGEAGPTHSAGLSVIDGHGWRVTDLRVDWSADPLADLTALVDLWLPQKADYIQRAVAPGASPGYGVAGDDRR